MALYVIHSYAQDLENILKFNDTYKLYNDA